MNIEEILKMCKEDSVKDGLRKAVWNVSK